MLGCTCRAGLPASLASRAGLLTARWPKPRGGLRGALAHVARRPENGINLSSLGNCPSSHSAGNSSGRRSLQQPPPPRCKSPPPSAPRSVLGLAGSATPPAGSGGPVAGAASTSFPVRPTAEHTGTKAGAGSPSPSEPPAMVAAETSTVAARAATSSSSVRTAGAHGIMAAATNPAGKERRPQTASPAW